MVTLALAACVGAAPVTQRAGDGVLHDPAFWLTRASAEWSQLDPKFKPWVEMAAAQAAAGDQEGLKRTLAEHAALYPLTESSDRFGYVFYRQLSLAPFYAQAGDERETQRLIQLATAPSGVSADDNKTRTLDSSRSFIAGRMAKIAWDAEASLLADSVEDADSRCDAFVAIALEAARGGREAVAQRAFAQAEKAARSVEARDKWARRPLADAYLELGDVERAINTAASMDSGELLASVTARAAAVCARDGRDAQAVKYSADATAIIVKRSWSKSSWGALDVADAVTEASHAPSMAALMKLAKAARAAPESPTNLTDNITGYRPSKLFALQCFQGFAAGAARRGDLTAARRHLADVIALASGARRPLQRKGWRGRPAMQVAEVLVQAGRPKDGAQLLTAGPYAVPEKELSNRKSEYIDGEAKRRMARVFEQAGDFERAAAAHRGWTGIPPGAFVEARVRLGQLQPLLTTIEALPNAGHRCAEYALTARKLAENQSSQSTTRSVRQ